MSDAAGRDLRVAAFAGSLRQGSYNRALLRAAVELAPPGLAIEILDLAELPLYNADVEARGLPAPVDALRRVVAAADGLLIVTPEYNHGLPAVTKNAVDWLSRPPRPHPLDGKPALIMGASPGGFGTVRSQAQLRLVLAATNTLVLPQPQVLVARAGERFDQALRLSDEKTRELVGRALAALAAWIRRLGPAA